MTDASNISTDWKRRRLLSWLVPRWRPSTWFVVLLAAIVLFFVEVPGRRVGATKYAHGWPFVYLQRDYLDDGKFVSFIDPFGGTLHADLVTAVDSRWQENRFPYTYEEHMSPWFYGGSVFGWAIVWDAIFGSIVLFTIGSLREWWRRRRPTTGPRRFFQYRLRTLLIAVPLVALVAAKLTQWHSEYASERALLGDSSLSGGGIMELHWQPPWWLPESVSKLGLAPWFAHVDELQLNDTSDETFDAIRKLRHLQILKCASLNPADLEKIARVSTLTKLGLTGGGVTAAGIKALAQLPRLRSLSLYRGRIDEETISEINRLDQLEHLDIVGAAAAAFDFRGLRNLKTLRVIPAALGIANEKISDFEVANQWSALMVAPQEPPTEIWIRAPIRLANMPQLSELSLTNVTLDADNMREIVRLPGLTAVKLDDCAIDGRMEIAGSPSLKALSINRCGYRAIAVRDAPQLASLDVDLDDDLSELTLESLPRLPTLKVESCRRFRNLSLRDLPALRLLRIDLSNEFFPYRYGAFRLRNADGLDGLRELSLRGCRFGPETAKNIGRLHTLQRIDFRQSWCGDADVEQFSGLSELRDCDLSYTDVTAKGLRTILALPYLERLDVLGSPVHFDEAFPAPPPSKLHLGVSFGVLSQTPHATDDRAAAARAGDPLAFWDHWNLNPRIADYDLGPLDNLPNVVAVNLWGAHVTDDGLKHLAGLTKLRALNLVGTRITNDGLRHLRGLTALESLSLAETGVDGGGLRALADLPRLKALDLGDCGITDDDLKEIARFSNVEVLRLAGAQITDAGFSQLAALHNLVWLDLAGTRVTAGGNKQLEQAMNAAPRRLSDDDRSPVRHSEKEIREFWKVAFPRGSATPPPAEPSDVGPIPPRPRRHG